MHSVGMGVGEQAGFLQRGKGDRVHLGLTPLPDLPGPGESPGWLAYVTLAKSLPITRPQFPHLQKNQDE